jgi:hypothetical protein
VDGTTDLVTSVACEARQGFGAVQAGLMLSAKTSEFTIGLGFRFWDGVRCEK